jgi:xanthine dehydrogenase YagT iron-sulfur-binding subunit
MSGNLCRCGAYAGIIEAVLEAQRNMTKSDLAKPDQERAA